MEETVKQYNETYTIKLRTSLGMTFKVTFQVKVDVTSIHDKNF